MPQSHSDDPEKFSPGNNKKDLQNEQALTTREGWVWGSSTASRPKSTCAGQKRTEVLADSDLMNGEAQHCHAEPGKALSWKQGSHSGSRPVGSNGLAGSNLVLKFP